MNTKTKEQKITENIISDSNNIVIIDNIIKYMELELNINLYKTFKTNTKVDKVIDIKKILPFYKQQINKLFNHVESLTRKAGYLRDAVAEGDRIINYKKALTVQSPNYSNDAGGFNNGYKPNSQEAKLLSVEEEIKKQQKRLIDYQLFMKSFEDHKELLKNFIELAPNNATGIEAVTRHYVFGEKWCDIARKLNYTENTIYSARKRLIEDLTLILFMSL